MLTSQATGITGYFSASAYCEAERFAQSTGTEFEITVYYGELESEDYDIFSEPEIDKFNCKPYKEAHCYFMHKQTGNGQFAPIGGKHFNYAEVVESLTNMTDADWLHIGVNNPKMVYVLDTIEEQYIQAGFFIINEL